MHHQRWRAHGDPLKTLVVYGQDEERWWAKVDMDGPTPSRRPELGPCWVWTASLDRGGYGWFRADGRMQKAHRWGYGHFVEPVARDAEVDHLCENRACVNYERHLEPVTSQINTERASRHPGKRTHCPEGHPYDEANTYRRPGGGRGCRACMRKHANAYYARKTRKTD